ncbi:MAG: hypothetical protein H7843_04355 [Nitrospirota bacterium]
MARYEKLAFTSLDFAVVPDVNVYGTVSEAIASGSAYAVDVKLAKGRISIV